MTAHADKAQIDKESFFSRFKTSGSKLFWAWVGYQAVKGTLTTAFIWLPLLYVWLG